VVTNSETAEGSEAVVAAGMRLRTIAERAKFLVKRMHDDQVEFESLREESQPLIELCIAADTPYFPDT
jgi:hypothetical protein